jgi:lipopolysaccharide transport system permease protein
MARARGADSVLELDARPATVTSWMADVWSHRQVLARLSVTDFQVRYKRATFGVLWAAVVPVLQALVLVVVFSKVLRLTGTSHFGAYVFAGTLAWGYFAGVLSTGATAIVDRSGLTDKVWFPRALLPLTSIFANLVSLAVSLVVLLIALPVLGVPIGPRLLLLVPAVVLDVAFSAALSLCLAALHVYFRDVRFLVQAALMVWFYLTPIAYPRSLLGHHLASIVALNPMTGVVAVFQHAAVGGSQPWLGPVLISIGFTVVLLVIAVDAHRRHDRLFVDLL